jgi:hypothetical protein
MEKIPSNYQVMGGWIFYHLAQIGNYPKIAKATPSSPLSGNMEPELPTDN